ncbi:o-methyltransferase [Colletotrichum musicola]|uniref:O-methyltransferase n=1 Tax=Colletotrichum musicola TaxID=2175873 RepID=A0A8H6JRG2_9PEZI|nr:o-methyltransferase [Colletotrichum musicola]
MSSGKQNQDPTEAFLDAAQRLTQSQDTMSEDDRAKVLLKLYELTAKVESPWETFMRPANATSLKVLIDLDLFRTWRDSGKGPMTTAELASLTGGRCEPQLLHRLLRLLAANHLLEMTQDGKFMPTKLCIQLADIDYGRTVQFYHDYTIRMFSHMPAFFTQNGYENPQNNRKTVFDSTFQWEGGLFKYLQAHAGQSGVFNSSQKTSSSSQTRWTSIFPSEKLLDSDPNLPLLVDVGGSIGHDVQAFHAKHPGHGPRLYLEDIPSVIADEKGSAVQGINKLAYNFFTPQPIKHARAYYMHHILHDWPDKRACKILEMQASAMKPGYSKLLIHDHVMSDDRPVHPHAAAFDMAMMVFGAAQERTEKEWRNLITSAGLKLVKIWRLLSAVESVIEVELPLGEPKI